MSNAAAVSIIFAVIAGQLGAIWYIVQALGARITDLGTVVGRLDTRLGRVEERLGGVESALAVVGSKLDQHDAELRDMRRGDQA